MKNIFNFFRASSLNAKITLTIFFIILNFTVFAVYVLYENYKIDKIFRMLSRHNEPTITLTFVAQSISINSLHCLEKAIIRKDASERKTFNEITRDLSRNNEKIMSHCDTIGLDLRQKSKIDFDTNFRNYVNAGLEVFDIIELSKDTAKYRLMYSQNIDSMLILKLKKCEDMYWSLHGAYFKPFHEYAPLKEQNAERLLARTARIVKVISAILIVSLILSIFFWFNISQYLTKSINKIIESIKSISEGELKIEPIKSQDEVAQVLKATNQLSTNLQLASAFAADIGKGQFNSSFSPVSEKDVLGHSLVAMQDELKKFKEEDEKRFWVNQGYAKFAEVIRTDASNLKNLGDYFISEMVKYVQANQGSLFVANENDENETVLEMTSCYAYNKKKHVDISIPAGEGLIGQAYLERDVISITDVPADYVKITSGLGEALPRAILIVPIKVEEVVYGVLEIASFSPFEQYKIDFIKKVGENLASVLLTVKQNEKTQILVHELKEKTQMMQAQEEEMRQNMEELMATQEEMQRKNSEKNS